MGENIGTIEKCSNDLQIISAGHNLTVAKGSIWIFHHRCFLLLFYCLLMIKILYEYTT